MTDPTARLDEALPCPFCGSPAMPCPSADDAEDTRYECSNDACFIASTKARDMDVPLAIWNHRAPAVPEKPQEAVAGELRDSALAEIARFVRIPAERARALLGTLRLCGFAHPVSPAPTSKEWSAEMALRPDYTPEQRERRTQWFMKVHPRFAEDLCEYLAIVEAAAIAEDRRDRLSPALVGDETRAGVDDFTNGDIVASANWLAEHIDDNTMSVETKVREVVRRFPAPRLAEVEAWEFPENAPDDAQLCVCWFDEFDTIAKVIRRADHQFVTMTDVRLALLGPAGTQTVVCGGDDTAKLSPQAREELEAFAQHIRLHRTSGAPDCRFCAEKFPTRISDGPAGGAANGSGETPANPKVVYLEMGDIEVDLGPSITPERTAR